MGKAQNLGGKGSEFRGTKVYVPLLRFRLAVMRLRAWPKHKVRELSFVPHPSFSNIPPPPERTFLWLSNPSVWLFPILYPRREVSSLGTSTVFPVGLQAIPGTSFEPYLPLPQNGGPTCRQTELSDDKRSCDGPVETERKQQRFVYLTNENVALTAVCTCRNIGCLNHTVFLPFRPLAVEVSPYRDP
ncbi:hypothetical protein VTK73DRAFT_5526 [Phialemonium thermophilum]|uniref:Uncharacterized protein n=1 Tax=Phialemonium thermophilum TaxID=223376 RepID=A0ABR3V264_9PEZI